MLQALWLVNNNSPATGLPHGWAGVCFPATEEKNAGGETRVLRGEMAMKRLGLVMVGLLASGAASRRRMRHRLGRWRIQ